MKKLFDTIFPAPWLSFGLILLWLLLNASITPGNLILAVALGLLIPISTRRLRPTRIRIRHLGTAIKLFMKVGKDSIIGNLTMAWQILRSERYPPRSCFVTIPLDLHDPGGLAALSTIVTVIPGTVWNEISLDRTALMLHVFNLETDEQTFINEIKTEYEKPLMEIFQ